MKFLKHDDPELQELQWGHVVNLFFTIFLRLPKKGLNALSSPLLTIAVHEETATLHGFSSIVSYRLCVVLSGCNLAILFQEA